MYFLKKTRDTAFKSVSKRTHWVYASDFIQQLAFFALAFVIFYTGHFIEWSVFSERDISRAVGWLKGHFYWPGPEMSGGNNLPGPFFYFLLFPAFLLGEDTYSQVALWGIIWLALTYTVAFSFITKIISHRESLLIFPITFLLSGATENYSEMLNPEFAVMFHVLALIGLYYWREKRNSLYLYLTGFVIALGIQTHLLVALHIITVLLFYIIDKSERKKIKTLLLFLLLALSPLLITNTLKYFHVFETSGRNYKEFTHWLLNQSFSEDWINNMKNTLFFASPLTFCCGLALWQKHKTKKWPLTDTTKNLLIITALPCLLALLGTHYYWYLLFIPVFSIILITKWLDDLIPDKKISFFWTYSLFITFYILIFNFKYIYLSLDFYKLFFIENKWALSLFCSAPLIIIIINALSRRQFCYKSLLLCLYLVMLIPIITSISFAKSQKTAIKESFSTVWFLRKKLYPLMERVYLETNWTPKIAMRHIFNIGIHPDRSLLIDYAMTVEKFNKTDRFLPLQKEKPQGYFIIQHLKKFTGWKKKYWHNYLSQSSLLSPILRQEITEDKIVIQEPKLYNSFWLIPYKTTENSLFPEGFHNIGQPYYWEEPEWLKQCSHTQTFQNEQGFFYCKVLPGHLQKAGLNIRFSEKENKAFLNIQFFGPLLGFAIPTVNTDGTSSWTSTRLYLTCNKKSFHWKLPDIGYHKWDTHYFPEKMAKMLLAPLKLRLPVSDCKKSDITKIKLTFTEKHTRKEHNKDSIIWKGD